MMKSSVLIGGVLAASICCPPLWAAQNTGHHVRRHAAHRHSAARRAYAARPYSSRVSPTITCRYPDGTPYDPDIIGGPNHVGAGGPAANLGGFYPCAF